ncbi:sulfotransferase family protein [Tautonia rosea]|uniref:hypothetical protein n=1 Tax=Tautonia rosea TaxID=2728037 RepID=UPI0014763DD4|nr:hypothetical protein [Tautonia rosea]
MSMSEVEQGSLEGADRLVVTPEAALAGQPLRLAVIGTPRSGNTWVRGLFASLYGLEELAVDRPEQLDWDRLPLRCILQIHQYPDPSFDALIERHGFRVLTPARHPLDVMISALNYAQHTPNAPEWTDASGTIQTLRDASPLSQAFRQYAGIAHPGSVLSFSPAWWDRPGVLRLRYEELVANPVQRLEALAIRIDQRIVRPPQEVIGYFTIDARRSNLKVWQYHFGLGRPGIWRELIPAELARSIADHQRKTFEVLGYLCDPDPLLDELQAERNWYRLQTQLLTRHLADERQRLRDARAQLLAGEASVKGAIEGSASPRRSIRRDSLRSARAWSWSRRIGSEVRQWWTAHR